MYTCSRTAENDSFSRCLHSGKSDAKSGEFDPMNKQQMEDFHNSADYMTYLKTSKQAKTWTQNWCAGMTKSSVMINMKQAAGMTCWNLQGQKRIEGWGSTSQLLAERICANQRYTACTCTRVTVEQTTLSSGSTTNYKCKLTLMEYIIAWS